MRCCRTDGSPEEAAALIYDGTLPSQQTIEGTLGDIAGQARDGAAALLVVGAVAGLRQHLRWFDERPLFGRRIVVTRSLEQAGELIEMLEERGAEAIPAPTIRIAPPEDADALEPRLCARPATFDWIVFTSGNGVEYFMERLLADERRPRAEGRAASARSDRRPRRGWRATASAST